MNEGIMAAAEFPTLAARLMRLQAALRRAQAAAEVIRVAREPRLKFLLTRDVDALSESENREVEDLMAEEIMRLAGHRELLLPPQPDAT